MSKNRQWYVEVDGKGMRMISERAITVEQATQGMHLRFGAGRVNTVRAAMPSDTKRGEGVRL